MESTFTVYMRGCSFGPKMTLKMGLLKLVNKGKNVN